jgi:hypothetical protein
MILWSLVVQAVTTLTVTLHPQRRVRPLGRVAPGLWKEEPS